MVLRSLHVLISPCLIVTNLKGGDWHDTRSNSINLSVTLTITLQYERRAIYIFIFHTHGLATKIGSVLSRRYFSRNIFYTGAHF